MVEKLELTVFDTEGTKAQLLRTVKSLHDRNEFRTDSWWTVVEKDNKAPDTFYISQTNGELGGDNPGRARVVKNQIWCGIYADRIASALKERGIPYQMGGIETDTSVVFDKNAKPFDLDGKVEEEYTPR